MKMKHIAGLAWATAGLLSAPADAQTAPAGYLPELHGTVRAKYEYSPPIGKGRFEVRNARLSAEGKVAPAVDYKAEIDLSDEGNIRMLDAFVSLRPGRRFRLTMGQMRVPFSIDAHRSPHLQYFANRSFIAKQTGDVRDVGIAAAWTVGRRQPVTLEGGLFNGSGLTNQKNFWTGGYNFALKGQTVVGRRLNITLSCQKSLAGSTGTMIYDIGAYWQNDRWHVEAEYLRKHYAHGAFRPVNAADAFAVCRLPAVRGRAAFSLLGRYDYMSDHSRGTEDAQGQLQTDDHERHRLTGGVTLHLGRGAMPADIRCNYEHYFYTGHTTPPLSEQSKVVLEFVAHF